jgi:polyisoprenoid-binding protein YceI
MQFSSTSFTKIADGSYSMIGNLTIKNVTKPIELQVQYLGTAVDLYGSKKVGFEILGSLKRSEYGLNWNATTEEGVIVLDEVVKLMLQVQMVLQNN